MPKSAWARSGAVRSGARGARPAGSWPAAIERARAAWDGLTGGPVYAPAGTARAYSDVAAAAILGAALGLWADTAAMLGDGGEDGAGEGAG